MFGTEYAREEEEEGRGREERCVGIPLDEGGDADVKYVIEVRGEMDWVDGVGKAGGVGVSALWMIKRLSSTSDIAERKGGGIEMCVVDESWSLAPEGLFNPTRSSILREVCGEIEIRWKVRGAYERDSMNSDKS